MSAPEAESETTFSAIADAGVLQTFIEAQRTIVNEAKLHLDEDGLHVTAVDPANVAMVDASVDAAAFEAYDATGGLIGVDLSRLEDVLGFANAGDLVHLELNAETRKLEIEVDGLSYTLALIDPQSVRQEPDIPELDLSARVVFEGAELTRGIDAVDLVTDHIRFEADPDSKEFAISGEGDTDDVSVTLDREDLIDAQVDDGAASLFSLDYFKDLKSAIPGDAEVKMRLGTEFPVKTSFTTEEGTVDVLYMVAPRITSE